MSKPEDIPQDVFEIAVKALYGAAPDDWVRDHAVIISRCARAIMAAEKRGEERERAACAAVADEREAICADAVAKIEAGELYQGIETAAASESCARLEAAHIAALIRARSA